MTTTEILLKIREIQENNDRRFFNKGIIPSFRKHPFLKTEIPDDNIFFSASLLYILNQLETYLTSEEQTIKSIIAADIIQNFKLYTNKPERNSYNFWRKESNKHFPNGNLLCKLNKFILPDDIDTTSLVQLCNNHSYEEALKTKQSLSRHANLVNRKIKNGHKCLQNMKAYSTWFGENMPIEFDLCVISNLFLWINKYNFSLNTYDLDSLQLIEQSISNSLYFKSAFKSSPEYPKLSIILYHLARLISTTNYLNHCKGKLIKDIQSVYSKTTDEFDFLLLSNSLIKLKSLPQSQKNRLLTLNPEIFIQWWFTAGFLSSSGNPITKSLAPYKLFHYRFYCPAFILTLYLENKILKEQTL